MCDVLCTATPSFIWFLRPDRELIFCSVRLQEVRLATARLDSFLRMVSTQKIPVLDALERCPESCRKEVLEYLNYHVEICI